MASERPKASDYFEKDIIPLDDKKDVNDKEDGEIKMSIKEQKASLISQMRDINLELEAIKEAEKCEREYKQRKNYEKFLEEIRESHKYLAELYPKITDSYDSPCSLTNYEASINDLFFKKGSRKRRRSVESYPEPKKPRTEKDYDITLDLTKDIKPLQRSRRYYEPELTNAINNESLISNLIVIRDRYERGRFIYQDYYSHICKYVGCPNCNLYLLFTLFLDEPYVTNFMNKDICNILKRHNIYYRRRPTYYRRECNRSRQHGSTYDHNRKSYSYIVNLVEFAAKYIRDNKY